MSSVTTLRWRSIERWSPTLLLVGGSLLVGHAAMLGIQAFSNLTTPPDVFGPTGHLVALVGLLGLYPVLAGRTPRVMRTAGTVAVGALVGWAVMTVTRFLAVAGLVASVSDVLPAVFFMLVFVSTILTYVLFGVTAVLVDESPRIVGLLVLAPAGLLVLALVNSVVTGVTALEGLVFGCGLALSVLALGYTLRTWDHVSDRTTPAGEVTVG